MYKPFTGLQTDGQILCMTKKFLMIGTTIFIHPTETKEKKRKKNQQKKVKKENLKNTIL